MKFNYYFKKIKHYLILDFKISREFGLKIGVLDFFKNFVFRKNIGVGKKIYNMKYELIKKKLLIDQIDIIEKYKNIDICLNSIEKNCKIWCFWWQGYNNDTPAYVKMCINSIKANNPEHEVIIITKDNIKEYVDFPDFYYTKLENGVISLTHFSDLLRVELLAKYGGIWIDSAFYLTRTLDAKIYKLPFYTIKHGLLSDFHVCKGLWTDGFIMSADGNLFFNYLKEMFLFYWEKYDFLVCYLLIDCYIALAYENIPNFKKMIDMVPYNNSGLFFIDQHGNEKYDEKTYAKVSDDTYIFRVHYKRNFETIKDNSATYFGKVVKNISLKKGDINGG